MYVFQRTEALIAFKLIDLTAVVDIKLVSAENGYSRAFVKGKDFGRIVYLGFDPFTDKRDLSPCT